jgi:hypothetical protein
MESDHSFHLVERIGAYGLEVTSSALRRAYPEKKRLVEQSPSMPPKFRKIVDISQQVAFLPGKVPGECDADEVR